MGIVLIFWLLCGVVCYFIMKSKGYPNNECLAHGVGGACGGIIWIIDVLCKKDYTGTKTTSQLSDVELLSKLMDLKERGAITEAEFLAKKREILGNVKKNDKTVAKTSTIKASSLRTIAVLMFLTACIICAIGWLLFESTLLPSLFPSLHISYHHLLYKNLMDWILLSYGAMAIICFVTVIILITRADIQFLCIPIIAESLQWVSRSYQMIKHISDIEHFSFYHFFTVLCTTSTILFLALVLSPDRDGKGKYPIILYIIPGICRAVYSIYWFIFNPQSPLNIYKSDFVFSLFNFFVQQRAILSIAFIFLGLLIQRLSVKKTKTKATL